MKGTVSWTHGGGMLVLTWLVADGKSLRVLALPRNLESLRSEDDGVEWQGAKQKGGLKLPPRHSLSWLPELSLLYHHKSHIKLPSLTCNKHVPRASSFPPAYHTLARMGCFPPGSQSCKLLKTASQGSGIGQPTHDHVTINLRFSQPEYLAYLLQQQKVPW